MHTEGVVNSEKKGIEHIIRLPQLREYKVEVLISTLQILNYNKYKNRVNTIDQMVFGHICKQTLALLYPKQGLFSLQRNS